MTSAISRPAVTSAMRFFIAIDLALARKCSPAKYTAFLRNAQSVSLRLSRKNTPGLGRMMVPRLLPYMPTNTRSAKAAIPSQKNVERKEIIGSTALPRIGAPSVIVAPNVRKLISRESVASNRLTRRLYDGITKSYAALTPGQLVSSAESDIGDLSCESLS
jgi:hypothetical protein